MKIKDLVKVLKQLPQNREVEFWAGGEQYNLGETRLCDFVTDLDKNGEPYKAGYILEENKVELVFEK